MYKIVRYQKCVIYSLKKKNSFGKEWKLISINKLKRVQTGIFQRHMIFGPNLNEINFIQLKFT